MNWLKRAIRKWLGIEPVTVNQTFVVSGEMPKMPPSRDIREWR